MAAAKADNDEAQQAGQEEQDFQALKRRIDKLVKAAGPRAQGLHDRVPARLEGQAAHGRPLLRLGQRHDQRRGAPGARPDRRDHRPRGRRTRSRSRATRTTGPSPPRSSRPTGSFPARAPGAVVQRLGAAGVSAKRMSLGGYGAQHPVATNAHPRRTREEPPGRDRPDPAARSNHVARRRLMNKKILIILVVALLGARRGLQDRPGQAEGDGAGAEGPRHRLRPAEGVPGQPRRRPLRQGVRGAGAAKGTGSPRPAATAPRRRPRATAPSPRRRSCATSSRTRSRTPRTRT